MRLTTTQKASASSVALSLGIPTDWLLAVVQSESAGNPKASNPKSTAKGLIQFTNGTAKSLGYASSADLVNRHPTFESQMVGPVRAYLKRYAPFSAFSEVVGAVFYPAYRKQPTKLLPPEVRAVNPFKTVQEYSNRVWSRYKGVKMVQQLFPAGSIVVGLGILVYLTRPRLRT